MTKSILFSVIAIGLAATVIGFAATQAAFTDSQTASGDVNAGTIDLYLDEGLDGDDNGENEFIFEPVENLLPGESDTETVRLINNGNRTFQITAITPTLTGDVDCDLVVGADWTITVTGVAVLDVLGPATSDNADVEVELLSTAGNECQGATVSASVVFDVSSP